MLFFAISFKISLFVKAKREKFHNQGKFCGSCQTAAGHPVVAVLFDRLDGALQNYAGRKMKAWQLKRKLQKCIGKPDELKRVVRDLPQGYAEFVRYLVDETTRTAITRTKENKRTLRALRDRMLSGAPRMSPPSTMSRRG